MIAWGMKDRTELLQQTQDFLPKYSATSALMLLAICVRQQVLNRPECQTTLDRPMATAAIAITCINCIKQHKQMLCMLEWSSIAQQTIKLSFPKTTCSLCTAEYGLPGRPHHDHHGVQHDLPETRFNAILKLLLFLFQTQNHPDLKSKNAVCPAWQTCKT